MCEPVSATTLAVAGVAATVIGTGVSAYAAYSQQQSANKAAQYNAQIQDRNASIAAMQAQQTVEQGAVQEKQHRQQVASLIGTQNAEGAGSGLLVNSGSNLDVTKDTAGFGELDALTIRNNAAREAWGQRNQGADYTAQGELSRAKVASPAFAAGTSLLSGSSQLVGQVSTYNRQGAFG